MASDGIAYVVSSKSVKKSGDDKERERKSVFFRALFPGFRPMGFEQRLVKSNRNMYTVLCKISLLSAIIILSQVQCKKFKDEEKPKWAKKDIRDYNDADMERLLDQWEEDEEPLEPDELPEHLRPQPNIDFSNVDLSDPENLLKLTKKGKTLMMFVSTEDHLTREETEEVTKLWQTGLWNNHIQAERYLIDDNRAIFMFRDGSRAWEAKDFLIEQENCKQVDIENKVYEGKHVKKRSGPRRADEL